MNREIIKRLLLDAAKSAARLVSGAKLRGGDAAQLANAKSVLFVRFSPHLGSAMCTTPLFGAIKMLKPDMKIGVLCDAFNYPILRHNPHIDEFFVVPNPLSGVMRAAGAMYALRKRVADYESLVVDLANARNIWSLPALLTGIGNAAGFGHEYHILDSRIPLPPRGTSELQGNLKLLKLFGSTDVPAYAEPELYFSGEEMAFVDAYLATNGIAVGATIVALQTQSKDSKPNRWYDERFAQLADRLVSEIGVSVVFTGNAGDAVAVERIRHRMTQPSVLAAGKTTVLQLAALLTRCRLFVTLDTGPMHIGRAVGIPMVILASAYQAPEIWLPVTNPRHVILRKGEVPCALCYKDHCATTECMEAITVAEVFEAARLQLRSAEIERGVASQ